MSKNLASTQLGKHADDKALLLSWYEQLLAQSDLLRLDNKGQLAIRDEMRRLEEDVYTLAICGQMNSGKSTLLNALLFGCEVLPAAPTTMTAKVTRLMYAEEPSVEARLYTPEEFRRVVSSAGENELSRNELDDARAAAAAGGIVEKDLLTPSRRVISSPDLGGLAHFVAVPDEGGLYTPYVQEVVVRVNLPWLKHIQVTDTPGTSDPNPERDRLTKDYIRQADAVVYVTYAGQAGMDAQDAEFLDRNLLHVDPAKRIIAVNKIDSVQNFSESSVRSYIRRLRVEAEDIRTQALFEDESQIVPVSGIAGLIVALEIAGKPLSETLKFYRQRWGDTDLLTPKGTGIERLRSLVEERIIETKGQGLIRSHQRRVFATLERARLEYQDDLDRMDFDREARSSSQAERDAERVLLERRSEELGEILERCDGRLKALMDKASVDIREGLDRVRREIDENIEKQMVGLKAKVSQYPSQCQWAVKRSIKDKHVDIVNALRNGVVAPLNAEIIDISEVYRDALAHGESRFKSTWGVHGISIRVDEMIQSAIGRIERHIEDHQMQMEASLKQAELWTWIPIIISTQGAKERVIAELKTVWEEVSRHLVDAICLDFGIQLDTDMRQLLGAVDRRIKESLDARITRLSEIERENDVAAIDIGKIKAETQRVLAARDQVHALKREYERTVAGI